MAVRTTDEAVQGIVEWDGITTLTPFIETASALVDSHLDLAAVLADYPTMDATRLELIERWLAAHAYHHQDQQASSESAGKGAAAASYFGKVDLLLFQTKYGQMAVMLDDSGVLAGLQRKAASGHSQVVSVSHWGKNYAAGDTPGSD